ncbi:MAG: DUF4230 domain-containing protein [Tepidisphaeraceae bacterium]
MFRKLLQSLILILLGAALGWFLASRMARSPAVHLRANPAPTIEQIQSLAMLTTVRVDVADVRLTELSGYTGGVRVAAIIKGDFYLATDLAQARFESVDRDRRTAVLILAAPRVSSPRLDHRRTKLFALHSSGLWLITPGEGPYAEAVNKTYAEAQASIEASAASAEGLTRARAQAEAVLGCFFRALEWDVTVRWDGR